MFRIPIAAAVLVAAACAAAPAQPVIKRQGVKEAAADIATAVRAAAAAEKLAGVRVGRFTAVNIDPDTAGVTLAAEVAHALGDLVNPKAESEVVGSYSFEDDAKMKGAKVLRVQAKLLHVADGKVLKNALAPETEVRFNTDVARLLAVTGAVDSQGSFRDRNAQIQKIWTTPTTAPRAKSESLVSPTADSAFGVELRGREAKPFAATIANGQAVVKTQKGEAFELRLVNAGAAELAVAVAVDGLDLFAASDDKDEAGSSRFTHLIVPAAKDGTPGEFVIPGRHKTTAAHKPNWDAFRAAAEGPAKLGMIHFAVEPSWPPGRVRDGRPISGLTPDGKPAKREGDVPTEFLTIHYQR